MVGPSEPDEVSTAGEIQLEEGTLTCSFKRHSSQ